MSNSGSEPLSIDYIDSVLLPEYRDAGFKIIKRDILLPSDWPELHTSWAKRLRSGGHRPLVRIVAGAADYESESVER